MKRIANIIFVLFSILTYSQELENFKGNKFYKFIDSNNNKLIFFLHGGLKNPIFKNKEEPTLDYLIEENNTFTELASQNNFDLIIPITNEKFNWIDSTEKSFEILKNYIQSFPKKYKEIYISGFSDGGTGSYKTFYNNSDFFDGLIVFSGYPQLGNFNKNVNYSKITDKKILFLGTFDDKTIPYEFLLTEYSKQKKTNANTYFYLVKGNHSFFNYKKQDLKEVFEILTNKTSNNKTEPIHGFVKNDKLIEFYPYRKKITRKYNYGIDAYKENKRQRKLYQQ